MTFQKLGEVILGFFFPSKGPWNYNCIQCSWWRVSYLSTGDTISEISGLYSLDPNSIPYIYNNQKYPQHSQVSQEERAKLPPLVTTDLIKLTQHREKSLCQVQIQLGLYKKGNWAH